MAFSRYGNIRVFRNSLEEFEGVFEERGVKHVDQFFTPTLRHPTQKNIDNLKRVGHIWRIGDRYYKLAHKHYGDANLWWVIAWYNKKPTESHLSLGDVVKIPEPLERVLDYYDI